MSFIKPTLLPHQELIRRYIIDHPFCGIFLGVGGGKTLTVLMALAAVRPHGHILVIAPPNIARSTWIDEIEKFGFNMRTRSLIVNDNDKLLTRAKRLARYDEVRTDPPTMYFISQNLLTDLVKHMFMTGKGTNQAADWPFFTVIFDESQGVKNPASERFKALATARTGMIRLIEMTGTPTPNGLLDLWSQVFLLDQGLALGTTMTAYKERYFRVTKYANNRPIKWEPLPGAEEEIYARVAHLVMSTKNTSITMPQATVEQVNVALTPDEMEAYKDFKDALVLDLASANPGEPIITVIAKNQAVLTNKLLQFASGTLYIDDKHNYRVLHDHKIEMADYLIRNTDSPMLVAYTFRSDRAEILSRLAAMGHDVRAFDGSRAMIKDWNAGNIPVMLLHPASAGPGLNLQEGGHTVLWYTPTDNLEHWIQLNGRVDRMGQKHPVTIYELVAKGTRDTRMPLNRERKAMVQDGLIDAVFVDADDAQALAEEFAAELNDLFEPAVF